MSRTVPMTANFPGLVQLLAEHLYPERGIFLREMIQNAHDSLVRRQDLEPAHSGRIDVVIDAARGTIAFVDNGTGMTAEEVVRYLTVLGESGTDEYRTRMVAEGRRGVERMIGQFGIGLLSGFLVSDRLTVETRSMTGASAVRWTYAGDASSTLEETDLPDLGVGTRVTLRVKSNSRHYLQAEPIGNGIVRYADFLPFPVHLNGSPTPLNLMHAPWHRSYAIDELRVRDYTRFVQRRFSDTPLEVIPVDLVEPYRVQGVLYISDRRIPDAGTVGTVDLYCKRMFVRAGEAFLLPPWAKFVRGVIDSPELTITASRSDVQRESAAFQGIQDALAAVLIGHLKELAQRDERHFQKIVRWHHYHIRGMALAHDEFFRAVADLVPFETSAATDQGLMTLCQYCAKGTPDAGSGKVPAYYFSELGAAAQFNEMCNARGLVVINASYAFDEAFLQKYAELHPGRVELRRLDENGGAWLFDAAGERAANTCAALVREFNRLLNAKGQERAVRAVAERFFPTDLPAVVTLADPGHVRRRLEEFQHHPILGEGLAAYALDVAQGIKEEPLVLHLNVQSPLILRLAATPLDDAVRTLLIALYNNAMLLSSQLQSERNLKTLYGQTARLIEDALDHREERMSLKRELEAARAERLPDSPRIVGLAEVLRDRLGPEALAAVLRAYPDAGAVLADTADGFASKTGLDAATFALVRARIGRERGAL